MMDHFTEVGEGRGNINTENAGATVMLERIKKTSVP